jgi:hypothetical protein
VVKGERNGHLWAGANSDAIFSIPTSQAYIRIAGKSHMNIPGLPGLGYADYGMDRLI